MRYVSDNLGNIRSDHGIDEFGWGYEKDGVPQMQQSSCDAQHMSPDGMHPGMMMHPGITRSGGAMHPKMMLYPGMHSGGGMHPGMMHPRFRQGGFKDGFACVAVCMPIRELEHMMKRRMEEAGEMRAAGYGMQGLGQVHSSNVRCEVPETGKTLGYAPCTYSSLEEADACCRAAVAPHSQSCRKSTL